MSKNLITQNELSLSNNLDIKTMIYEIRGQKVMLDSDLAKLYGYTVKRLNEQVQRNIDRFPSDFMFQLTKEEATNLRSQFATSSYTNREYGGRRYLPYVFTEQGVYMLATVLKSELAIRQSILIIRAFKELKDFYNSNQYLLQNINDKLIQYQTTTNNKLIEHDNKFNQIFDYISDHKEVTEKIFFKGQIYNAYSLLVDLIKKANKEIILIDNYIDKTTLDILSNKKESIDVSIYTLHNKLKSTDISKFNTQYPTLNIKKTNKFHDRFLILDNKTIYLIGASIKDAGNKCFGIVEIDSSNIKRIRDELKK